LFPIFQLFKLAFAHCFLFVAAGPDDQFAYFWITDSRPQTVKAISQHPPFEVLSLASSIADALQI
jgi:hypothetical protein